MSIAYLIFSHLNPDQVLRLARALRRLSPNSHVVIHHDPSSSAFEAKRLEDIDNAWLVPDPIPGQWGDFSLVAQYLHALTWCRAHLQADWLVILTGQTYPVRPLGDFERQLAESPYDAYVGFFDALAPGPWPHGTAETRYLFRYAKLPKCLYCYKLPVRAREALRQARERINGSQSLFRIIPLPRGAPTRLGIRRLSTPFGRHFKLYGGSQLMTLNRKALEYVLEFVDRNPWYGEYFRRTIIPDEAFFVTMLANAPSLRLCNDVLRYINWPKDRPDAANVAVIGKEELQDVLRSGAHFALKFDTRVDSGILDMLDRGCL